MKAKCREEAMHLELLTEKILARWKKPDYEFDICIPKNNIPTLNYIY